jgi:hypothetical protein
MQRRKAYLQVLLLGSNTSMESIAPPCSVGRRNHIQGVGGMAFVSSVWSYLRLARGDELMHAVDVLCGSAFRNTTSRWNSNCCCLLL